jgi:ATP-dependent Lon protease
MDLTNISKDLPIICTRGIIYFPHVEMRIEVGREKSVAAIIESSTNHNSYVLILSQKDPEIFDPQYQDIFEYGTIGKIKNIKTNTDGSRSVLLESINRVKITKFTQANPMLRAEYEVLTDLSGDKNEEIALVRTLAKTIQALASSGSHSFPQSLINELSKGISAPELADNIAHYLPISIERKQSILETLEVNKRLRLIIDSINEEKVINELETEINQKVREKIDESQREYVLREKLRAIKEELGDTNNKDDDADAIRKMVEENPYPENVKAKVLDELKRYEALPPSSAEASIIKTYLDWVLKTPWYQKSDDNNDLRNVEKVLNDDHFGLEKIKERILEYLAVKKLTDSLKAPIICFSGPPGTGKTSLANSIARALGRKFVKISLGGVRDEAEIRGHRRTYLGSLPGRIIQGMKKAGVINPVFLLDEIDKVGADYKGDPSNALLEVLDPEQNKAFSDNYLEEPYDLSNVLFIATANYLENIPTPLRDRLEIIELSSYTELEKMNIALKHLVNKQAKENGIIPSKISFNENAILHIIRYYTREAGVRSLERMIGTICRKVAVKLVKDQITTKQVITVKDVTNFLGKEKFEYSKKEKKNNVGVTTGLAYTQYGGDILPVEAVLFEGKGALQITGNLGKVMTESASIAIGYIRSHAKKYKINPDLFNRYDIHIHCPEGAVPKDGPSAGVTITTSLISALTNTPVRSDIAMTGEITLRGNVLPIGGLKEKSIAAHRSGVKTIFIPKDNEKDLEDIPESVRKDLEIILVDNISKIIEAALVEGK